MAGGSASARYVPEASPYLPFDHEDMQIVRVALTTGFWGMLKKFRPERWTDLSLEHEHDLFQDIKDATGYQVETVAFHRSSEKLFDSFCAKNFGKSLEENGFVADDDDPFTVLTVFHGSSKAGVQGICKDGFDEKRLRNDGVFGNGVYVSPDACVALRYAQPCEDGRLRVLFGQALLGDLERIPVGRRAQTDFGKHPDGSDVLTLRDEEGDCFCMKCENANNGQLLREGYLAFSIDTSQPPSDFALCYMYYPLAVWAEFQKNVPGIVARR
jgi:hypothetical protein